MTAGGRPPAARVAVRAGAGDHAALVVQALAAHALRRRLPGAAVVPEAATTLDASAAVLAFAGRSASAVGLAPLAREAADDVDRARRRMALARAGVERPRAWAGDVLVAGDGTPLVLADGLDVLALADELGPAGAPALVAAAVADEAPAGDDALDALLDAALAHALAAAWAAAGTVDPGAVALAERRAAESRAAGDRDGAGRLVERLRRQEQDLRAALADRTAEVEHLQALLRDAQTERDDARITLESLLREQHQRETEPTPDEPAAPRGLAARLRRRPGG